MHTVDAKTDRQAKQFDREWRQKHEGFQNILERARIEGGKTAIE